MSRIVLLALAYRAVNGFCLGLYILVYLRRVGLAVHTASGGPASYSPMTLGLLFLLAVFVLEIGLQFRAGWVADRFGPRAVLTLSFVARAFFFLMLGLALWTTSPVVLFTSLALAAVSFAVAYTTLEGNYEVWLKSIAGKTPGVRLFGFAAAIQHCFTIIGCFISLAALGSATQVTAASSLDLVQLFLIAAGTCFAAALSAIFIPRSNDALPPRRGSGMLWVPKLIPIFTVWAVTYGLLQVLSAVVPLALLAHDQPLGPRFLVLGLGSFGPALLGSALAAFRTSPIAPQGPASTRQIRSAATWFGVSALLFGVLFYATQSAAPDIRTAALTISLCLARFAHGRVDPLIQAQATQVIQDEKVTHPNMAMSVGAWFKHLAGAGTMLLAVLASIFAPESAIMAAVLVPVSLGLLAVAWVVLRQRQSLPPS